MYVFVCLQHVLEPRVTEYVCVFAACAGAAGDRVQQSAAGDSTAADSSAAPATAAAAGGHHCPATGQSGQGDTEWT